MDELSAANDFVLRLDMLQWQEEEARGRKESL